MKTIVDASFVPREYYVEPPSKDSAPEAWKAWLEADSRATSAAKRRHTLGQRHADLPDTARPKAMIKAGGVWRQSSLIGFVGDPEQGTSRVEAAIEADQEVNTHIDPWVRVGGRGKRGTKRNGSAKRKARKARR